MNRVRTSLPATLAAAGFVTALLPLGTWYVRRMRDGSDEPLGVIALAVALVLVWISRDALRGSVRSRNAAVTLLGIYGVTVWMELPPLLRALPALGAVACWTGLWRLPGPTILLGLSLPVVASLQFYLGYPMRVMTAGIATGILNFVSIPVTRAGTQLQFDGTVLGVDAPCSGIRMLWMSCFLGAVLSGMLHLRWWPAIILVACAGVVALLANSMRAMLLFFPEADLVHLPSWCHEGTGILLHALAMTTLLSLARRLQSNRPALS